MTRPQAGRERLREAQLSLAARTAVLMSVVLPALVTGPLTQAGGGLAIGAVGSVAVTVAVWAVLAPVVLRALALQGAVRVSVPRERARAARSIRRADQPGRPGRARPRAPGVGPAPRPAH